MYLLYTVWEIYSQDPGTAPGRRSTSGPGALPWLPCSKTDKTTNITKNTMKILIITIQSEVHEDDLEHLAWPCWRASYPGMVNFIWRQSLILRSFSDTCIAVNLSLVATLYNGHPPCMFSTTTQVQLHHCILLLHLGSNNCLPTVATVSWQVMKP